MNVDREFLRHAVELAYTNCRQGGRPFGAVVVKDNQIIAQGVNQMLSSNDPTAHAELLAIREASQYLKSPNLAGCTVFASGHPCPMCLAAMRMAGVERVVYAYSNEDAEAYGLSTAALYDELAQPFAQQSMQICYVPTRPEHLPEIYAYWQSINIPNQQ